MSSDGVHRKIVQYEWTDAVTASSPVKGGAPSFSGTANMAGGSVGLTGGSGGSLAPSSGSVSSPFHGGVKKEFYGAALACGDKKAYLIGGYDPKRQCSMRQVVEFSLGSKQWTRQADLPERRSRATAVAFEDYCFLWGGWDDAHFCDGLWVLGAAPDSDVSTTASGGGATSHGGTGAGAGSGAGTTGSNKGTKEASGGGHGTHLSSAPFTSPSTLPYRWRYYPPAGTQQESPCPVPSGRIGHSLVLGHVMVSPQPGPSSGSGSRGPRGVTSKSHGVVASVLPTSPSQQPSQLSTSSTASTPSRGNIFAGTPSSSVSEGKKGGSGGPPSAVPSSSAGGGAGAAPLSPSTAAPGILHSTTTTTTPLHYAASSVNLPSSSSTPTVEPVLYLFGGFDGKKRLNDVWRLYIRPTLETKEAVWEEVKVGGDHPVGSSSSSGGNMMMPSPRDDAAVAFAAPSEKLYVFGGYDEALCNDLHVLELKDGKNQWVDIPVLGPPTRRQGSIAAADENNLIVCMGSTMDQQSIPQLLQISLKENKWKLLAVEQCIDLLSDREGYIGCCGAGNKRLLVYGGGGGPTPFKMSMVEIELERSEPSTVSAKKK